jgi:hypothetical protein
LKNSKASNGGCQRFKLKVAVFAMRGGGAVACQRHANIRGNASGCQLADKVMPQAVE